MPKPDPDMVDDEVPELGDDFFSRARPAAEVMGEAFMARARKAGRPKVETPKVPVKLRFDANIVAHLRASGRGWQTRVNAMLAEAIKAGRL